MGAPLGTSTEMESYTYQVMKANLICQFTKGIQSPVLKSDEEVIFKKSPVRANFSSHDWLSDENRYQSHIKE